MAEREGFEPPIPVKVCPLSRRIVSTTHAPLRVGLLAESSSPLGLVRQNCDLLTAISKERLQQLSAASGQNSGPNLNGVIQLGMVQDSHD